MTKNLTTRMNKKTSSTKSENDVTHAIQLNLHERMKKKADLKWLRRHMVVTKILKRNKF